MTFDLFPARRALFAFAFFLACGIARANGFSFIEVPADAEGPALRGAVWVPCAKPAGPIVLAPLVIQGVRDCPAMGERLPLVVISHGTGGSFLGHHDTAEALADAGFVVAAISHPGDNFADLSRQTQLSTFASRPADMRRLVDYMLGRWPGRAQLAADRIGIFGFSRGGYTGLVAVGAVPDFRRPPPFCRAQPGTPLCMQIGRDMPSLPVADPRIRAAVIVDPLSLFEAGSFSNVRVPIQLWASEFGGDGVLPQDVDAIRRRLPQPLEFHVATGAEHFGFLAPCSPAMAAAAKDICTDRPGFDRVAFHRGFDEEVVGFFEARLKAGAAP